MTAYALKRYAVVAVMGFLCLSGCDRLGLQDEEGGPAFSVDVPHETLTSGSVQTEPLDSGQYAALKEGTRTVLRTEAAYRSFWQTVHASTSTVPERPDVNFRDQVVVAVVLGERPTGGYGVDLTSVKGSPDAEALRVTYTETVPEDCAVPQVLTSPYVLAAVDGDGEFVFESRETTGTCG